MHLEYPSSTIGVPIYDSLGLGQEPLPGPKEVVNAGTAARGLKNGITFCKNSHHRQSSTRIFTLPSITVVFSLKFGIGQVDV